MEFALSDHVIIFIQLGECVCPVVDSYNSEAKSQICEVKFVVDLTAPEVMNVATADWTTQHMTNFNSKNRAY